MTAPLEICLADRMRSQPVSFGGLVVPGYGSERDLVQSVVDALNDAWASHGVAGAEIVDASFDGEAVSISTRPGAQALSVATVSHFIRAARASRKAVA